MIVLKDSSQNFGKLENLKDLKLDFTSCSKIGTQSLSSISNFLKKLTSLTKLHLIFDCYLEIKDEGLKALGSGLKV